MNASIFDWSKLIAGISDDSFGIPTDVTFQIVDESGAKRRLQEVKAHKMILGMVSDPFKTMFYATQVGDKTAIFIRIEKTTAPAFRIMLDGVYNVKSIGDSLKAKSVHEVFDVVNLVERYQIRELMEASKEHLANYPVTEDTVLEVAGDAMEYTNMFEVEVQQLLLTCAKFLKDKLKDANSLIKYAAKNKGEAFYTLLDLMNDLIPTECPNCRKQVCQNGEEIKDEEFRVGLLVTNRKIGGSWREDLDLGTGIVTNVGDTEVTVVNVTPGLDQDGVIGGEFTADGYAHDKTWNGEPDFLFACN